MNNKLYDIIIVGAGPAGLSCAIEAQKSKVNCLLIEKGNIVNSIVNFPVDMTFFSTADQLELDNIPFNSQNFRPTRSETVRYYQRLVSYFKLNVSVNSFVTSIAKEKDLIQITFEKQGIREKVQAKNVVIATGFYDNPNYLNVPGEDLEHVSHYFSEALRYFNQDVVIVGGKNSAVEAALELFRSGANVTIIHRENEIKESVKYWVLPDIQNRINEGSVKTFLNAQVTGISKSDVSVKQNGKILDIPADAVFLLTGYHPDPDLLDISGIRYNKNTLEPDVNESTLESSIKGIYLAGSIIAGRNANRIFIENSREHGGIIIEDIVRNS